MTTAYHVHDQDSTASPSRDSYLSHQAAIEAAIRAVCRRHRLRPEDADDFASQVRLHLVQGDYAVLRRFQGRSSLSTYLLTVVMHLGQDWRNARWGKWRTSVEARRQGPVAVHLERLIRRDGMTFDEAFETLRTNFRVAEPRATIEAMAATLPRSCRRRLVGDESLENRPANDPTPDAVAEARAESTRASSAMTHLTRAIAALPPADALVLKLRFEDGLPIVDIARALGMQAKPLYRRIERVLRRIRIDLEAQGLCATTVRDVLAGDGLAAIANDPHTELASYRLFPASLPPPERVVSHSY
jgi:RNA polymerase sigma factor for flagellar operon FliA